MTTEAMSESGDHIRQRSQRVVNGVLANGVSHPEPHPFFYTLYPTTLDKILWLLAVPTLLPLRFLITCVLLFLAWLSATIAVVGWPVLSDRPLTGWRLALKKVTVFLVRCAWFTFGIMSQKVIGRQVSSKEAPIIVMGPHSSFADTLGGACCGFPGVISAIENAHLPFIGTLFRVNESIFVERGDPDSRRNAAQEVHRRAATGGAWPQLVVFPEGFCCNRNALPPYNLGAFLPAVPVQPVLVRYPNRLDTTTWVNSGPGILAMANLLFLTPITRFEIEFLPVYHPSEEEKNNPQLYSENVRELMGRKLGIPRTDLDRHALAKQCEQSRPRRGVASLWKSIITKGYVEMPSRDNLLPSKNTW